MALDLLTTDVSVHQSLPDELTASGYTKQAIKIAWDGPAEALKAYANVLATFINSAIATADIALYVSGTGNDTTGDGSEATPYATTAKALSMIPKDLNGKNVYIYIASSVASSNTVNARNFFGGKITLVISGAVTLTSITADNSILNIAVEGGGGSGSLALTSMKAINRGQIWSDETNLISGLTVTTGDINNVGISASNDSAIVITPTVTINNTGTAVYATRNARIYLGTIAGTGNTLGLSAATGGVITYNTKTISATTPTATASGGEIRP